MPRAVGSLVRGAALVALVAGLARPAAAQRLTPAPAPPPDGPTFLADYDFHLSASKLAGVDDERFSWDTHFGGDLDVVDYVAGRVNLLADYEAVLGTEYRAFDPNQGNYTLEASVSARAGATEIAAVLHHVSRHLSDRPKPFGVDWNVLGARVLRHVGAAGWSVDAEGWIGRVIKADYVDYAWRANADATLRRRLRPAASVFAHATLDLFGVDETVLHRGTQTGVLAEAGVALQGRAGAVELFAGAERRVDAYPLDRIAQRRLLVGFRFVNRVGRFK